MKLPTGRGPWAWAGIDAETSRSNGAAFLTGSNPAYDAILVVGFGGPEKREDVVPFLENVLRGRNVPRERMLEVARHYEHFDGRSPINDQMRDLITALKPQLAVQSIRLPIYWGNHNWHPLLSDTFRGMTRAAVATGGGCLRPCCLAS